MCLKLRAVCDNIRENDTTLEFPQTSWTDQTFLKAHLKISWTKFNTIPRQLAQCRKCRSGILTLNDTCQTLLGVLNWGRKNNIEFRIFAFGTICRGRLEGNVPWRKNLTKFSDSSAYTKEVFHRVRRRFKLFGIQSKDWFLVCYSN